MLALFFITFNTGSVFFQIRGVPSAQVGLSVLGYMGGVLFAALFLDHMERRSKAANYSLLRTIFLGMLLLPGLTSLIAFPLLSYAGNLALNMLQPFLWGLGLPVGLRLFFKYATPAQRVFHFGIAVGSGHLCWSLLMLPAGMLTTNYNIPSEQILFYLNIMRVLFNTAFALLAWWMLGIPDNQTRDITSKPRLAPGLIGLLLPFALCFLLNGILGYLFYSRVLGRGIYSEYMHLGLAFLLPLAGLLISRKPKWLPLFICMAVVAFALGPLFLLAPNDIAQKLLIISTASQQSILFLGTLAVSGYASRSRSPALVISLVWLATALAVPGSIIAGQLSIPVLAMAGILAGLCVIALWPFYQAWRVAPVCLPTANLSELANNKKPAFAAAFALTEREDEVLSYVLQGMDDAAMANALGISERTVRYHISGLLNKAGVINRKRLLQLYNNWNA